MKRILTVILAAAMLLAFSACGRTATYQTDMQAKAAPVEGESYSYTGNGLGAADAEMPAAMPEPEPAGQGMETTQTDPAASYSDKIIYSAYANVETREFDASLQAVYDMVKKYDGFLESSSVTGADYSGRRARSAYFVMRIPSDSFETVTASLSDIGNVPMCRTSADNISAQYYDNASRLAAYQVEYDRLMAMLEKAETVEEMLAIESRLSDVRYSIESLTTTQNYWDSQVSYSTLELQLDEVVEYTDEPVEPESYGERLLAALSASIEAMGDFFRGALVVIVAALPAVVLLGVAAIIVVCAVRSAKKKKARALMPVAKEAPAPAESSGEESGNT